MKVEHVSFNANAATLKRRLRAGGMISSSLEIEADSIKSSIPVYLRYDAIDDLRIECQLICNSENPGILVDGTGTLEYCNVTGSVWHDASSCLRAQIAVGRETFEYVLQRLCDHDQFELEFAVGFLIQDDEGRVWNLNTQRTAEVADIEICDTRRIIGVEPMTTPDA